MTAAPRRGADRALLRDRPDAKVETKRAAVLSAEQISTLMDLAGPRDRALIALMVSGALRVGEATLLTWSDFDDCRMRIPGGITKTGAGRSFTLPDAACGYVEAWRQQCPQTKRQWIFPGVAGNPLSVRGAQTAIAKLAKAAGFSGVSSHSFRRSALTAAHAAGLSLREVAEISGHSSLAALEKYLDQDAAKEKAEAARGLLFGG